MIHGYPHDMPKNTLKWLPKFSSDNVIYATNHLEYFKKAIGDMHIEHYDIIMKLFPSTLEGNGILWFKNLPNNCINSYNMFGDNFLEEWDGTYDS